MDSTMKKVVIVDDNETDISVVRNMLKSLYEVIPAPSVIKLFTFMGNHIPDLVLLDIDMPAMNGFEAIKAMKEHSRYKDIPVVFLTGKNDDTSVLEGLNLGATDYVTKPFSGPLLLQRISNILLIEDLKKELHESETALKDLRRQIANKGV